MSEHTLSREKAAIHLGVSVKSLSRYMKNHGLPSIKVMGANNRMEYRFSIEELDKWTYVRQKVEHKGKGQVKDRTNTEDLVCIEKGQHETGHRQDNVNIKEGDKAGREQGTNDNTLSLLLSSYQQQISTLERQLAALQEQLVQKDAQIRTLQETSGNLLQLVQAQMNRIEHRPEPAKMEPPPRATAKPSPDRKEVLSRIQELHKQGLSHLKIAGELNSQGLPTFSGRGQWQAGTVQKLLKQHN